jgi:hypothetical protein
MVALLKKGIKVAYLIVSIVKAVRRVRLEEMRQGLMEGEMRFSSPKGGVVVNLFGFGSVWRKDLGYVAK